MTRAAVLKFTFSFAMLLLAFSFVDFSQFTDSFQELPLWIFPVLIIGYALSQVASAFKWWLITRSAEFGVPFPTVLKSYFIGMFVNFFGLGVIGGDVARGILISPPAPSRSGAIASVFADRIHGLTILALLGLGAVVLFGLSGIDSNLAVVLVVVICFAILGWFSTPMIVERFFTGNGTLSRKIRELKTVLPQNPRVLLEISALSLAFHLFQIGLHMLVIFGMGASIPISYLLIAIPFVSILSSLPVSWNGLGVRENTYIFFLAPTYLNEGQAVALGVVWLMAVVFSSIVGGCVAFLTDDFSRLRESKIRSRPLGTSSSDGAAHLNL